MTSIEQTCARKLVFTSYAFALADANRLFRRTGEIVYPYRCVCCQQFHNGHSKPDAMNRADLLQQVRRRAKKTPVGKGKQEHQARENMEKAKRDLEKYERRRQHEIFDLIAVLKREVRRRTQEDECKQSPERKERRRKGKIDAIVIILRLVLEQKQARDTARRMAEHNAIRTAEWHRHNSDSVAVPDGVVAEDNEKAKGH